MRPFPSLPKASFSLTWSTQNRAAIHFPVAYSQWSLALGTIKKNVPFLLALPSSSTWLETKGNPIGNYLCASLPLSSALRKMMRVCIWLLTYWHTLGKMTSMELVKLLMVSANNLLKSITSKYIFGHLIQGGIWGITGYSYV